MLLRNLARPGGVAVSEDGSFVLVSETTGQRIIKYYVKGTRANTSATLITFQGIPGNIKRTLLGDFWVAVNLERHPSVQTTVPTGQKINASGTILRTVNLEAQHNTTVISEVQERLGKLI